MATFTFDGTSSIVATKNDTVLISADPQSFTQASDNGSSVTLAFGVQSITITGTTLAPGNLPNVFVTGGQFSYANTSNQLGTGTGNVLSFLNSGTYTAPSTTASSKVAIFGGLGRVDSIDGADTLQFGGKGSFLVFGNGGDDYINNNKTAFAFDSTSVVNTYGDQGNDTIDFQSVANAKASIYVNGGDGLDYVLVNNTGTSFIQGGLDSTDGADRIVFDASAGNGSTSYIYGNGGDDQIQAGLNVTLDATSKSTIFGGFGNDTIQARGAATTLTAIGGEGSDNIAVTNGDKGLTFITGGNPAGGDQSSDGADDIRVIATGGDIAVYGNLGNDTILTIANLDGATVNVYGGKDNDLIQSGDLTRTGKNTEFYAGGEGSDTITASGNGGALTIFGGISSADSTDGSDTIRVGNGSTGNINVFANAGNDGVGVNTLGNDSVNTATIRAGIGADTVFVSTQNNGAESLSIFGDEGPDAFAIAKGSGTTVTVADFTVSDGDQLALYNTGGTGTLQVTGGPFQTLQQALDAAAKVAGANGAGAVVFAGSAYVVLETAGNSSFNPAADQAIKLTGVTDLVALSGATTIVS